MHSLLPQNLQYANDAVLMVETHVDVKEMIHTIKEENTARLFFNIQKNKKHADNADQCD